MSKFGLGRGLADLKAEMGAMPEISVLAGGERVAVRHIPVAAIAPNPDQPRKTFAANELEELANSIREKGVLQPILVRAAQGKANQYEIIAGERRWRASKLAGIAEIPALVKTLNDENAMEIALIENVQRENLNAVEESAAYENLMIRCGYTIEDVAKLIGKSVSYLRNSLRLAGLPESVKKMVADGRLSATHARTLAVAENPEALARKIIASGMSVKDTDELVKNSKRSKKSRSFSQKPQNIAEFREIEKQIKKNTGLFAKIQVKRSGAGQVAILFDNRAQMEKIIERLK
ncbi:MAG: ParB/RepB/Spo0J family partition protein [Alphaproteobacteria bacterium]|nr:ParB/RepB/Spo0J family partition protein [Alphaproteobacteria bacterium]